MAFQDTDHQVCRAFECIKFALFAMLSFTLLSKHRLAEIKNAFKEAVRREHPDRNLGNPHATSNFARLRSFQQNFSNNPEWRENYESSNDEFVTPVSDNSPTASFYGGFFLALVVMLFVPGLQPCRFFVFMS